MPVGPAGMGGPSSLPPLQIAPQSGAEASTGVHQTFGDFSLGEASTFSNLLPIAGLALLAVLILRR